MFNALRIECDAMLECVVVCWDASTIRADAHLDTLTASSLQVFGDHVPHLQRFGTK